MPYESVTSIFIKASHLNFIGTPQLAKLVGSPRSGPNTFSRLDVRNFLPVKENNYPHGFAPVACLGDERRGIKYCPKCIAFGYHSVFNMITVQSFCHVHKCALKSACKVCSSEYLKGYVPNDNFSAKSTTCACGFHIIEMVQEIRMRRNNAIPEILRKNGEELASWYGKLFKLYQGGHPHARSYYESLDERGALTEPLEQLMKLPSPERVCRILGPGQKVFWMRHPAYNSRVDGLDFNVRTQTVQESCDAVEKCYLKSHRNCLIEANAISGYPDGQPYRNSLCPVALAYVLMRLKLAYPHWPIYGGVSALEAGFVEFSSVVSSLGDRSVFRELRMLFLWILGELQYMIERGCDFRVVCRQTPMFSVGSCWPVYIRRSSFRFRNCCFNNSRMSLDINRDGSGGALTVSLNSSKHASQSGHLDVLIV
ncbi:hypothetical protein [Pseudomonas caspiana]|uniref:hypothetical protein n=1 Tax=Pseudomonas caspiana TaxID=1451454 RepID=UPI0035576D87